MKVERGDTRRNKCELSLFPSGIYLIYLDRSAIRWVFARIVTYEPYLGLKYNLSSSIPSEKEERLSNKLDAAALRT